LTEFPDTKTDVLGDWKETLTPKPYTLHTQHTMNSPSFTIGYTDKTIRRWTNPARTERRWHLAPHSLTTAAMSSYTNQVASDTTDTFVYANGHKWRRWCFVDDDRKVYDVAFRERKALKGILTEVPKTREGYERLVSGMPHLIQHLTTIPETHNQKEDATEWRMTSTKVAYVGLRGAMTLTRVLPRRSHPFVKASLPTLLISPVQTEETPTRVRISDYYYLPVQDFNRHPTDNENVHFLNADGTLLFTGLDYFQRQDRDIYQQWHATCSTMMLAQRHYVGWDNRVPLSSNDYTGDPFCHIALSDLRSHAGQTPLEVPELETLREERRALKEALAMAVFRPDRVERMMETYGEDWMERV